MRDPNPCCRGEAKYLNTPRQVYDDQAQLRWKWDQAEPFGVTTPDENPVNLGAFELPFRFPGQYADKESGIHYNLAREYDTGVGRYLESDPVGLTAGINTFTYSYNTPLRYSDLTGFDVTVTHYPGGPGHVGIAVNSSATVGLYPKQRSLAVGLCRDVPGVVLEDHTRQSPDDIRRSKSTTIKTTSLQDSYIQQYIDAVRNNPNVTYNLCSQQCSRFVIDALSAGGIGLPRFDSVRPQDVIDLLQRTLPSP